MGDEADGTEKSIWRLMPPEAALSCITIVAWSEEDLPDARKAMEELRCLFLSGEMFMVESLLGGRFMGSKADTVEFVEAHGGWATPCNLN